MTLIRLCFVFFFFFYFLFFFFFFFLVACTRLYRSPCRSVSLSVGNTFAFSAFSSGFCIIAPAQSRATGVVVYTNSFFFFLFFCFFLILLKLKKAGEKALENYHLHSRPFANSSHRSRISFLLFSTWPRFR